MRNPHERFQSAFNYALQGGGTDGGYFGPTIPNDPERVLRQMMDADETTVDFVFRRQSYFFPFQYHQHPLCLGLYSVDSLDVLVDDLNRLGLQMQKPERLNRTSYARTDCGNSLVEKYYEADLEAFEQLSHADGVIRGPYIANRVLVQPNAT